MTTMYNKISYGLFSTFLKLTRRMRVPFLSHFLLLFFVHSCSLFLLRFVLFVFSLSLLPHLSTLSFCFETKLSPVSCV